VLSLTRSSVTSLSALENRTTPRPAHFLIGIKRQSFRLTQSTVFALAVLSTLTCYHSVIVCSSSHLIIIPSISAPAAQLKSNIPTKATAESLLHTQHDYP
jgi:hypothetical protein